MFSFAGTAQEAGAGGRLEAVGILITLFLMCVCFTYFAHAVVIFYIISINTWMAIIDRQSSLCVFLVIEMRICRASTFDMVDAETVQQSHWCHSHSRRAYRSIRVRKRGKTRLRLVTDALQHECWLESKIREHADSIIGGRSVLTTFLEYKIRGRHDIARSCDELQQQVSAIAFYLWLRWPILNGWNFVF